MRELSCKFDEVATDFSAGLKIPPKPSTPDGDCSSLHSEESNSLVSLGSLAAANNSSKMEVMMHISNECRSLNEAVQQLATRYGH